MTEQTLAKQKENVLVEIKDLRTYFHLAEGVVHAVDGVDLTIHRGETLGIVGESGCGKSISAYSMLRLVSPPGKIEGGEILFYKTPKGEYSGQAEVVNITKLNPGGPEIRHLRGNYISMVFQEPMTAMSPVRTVGQQIIEAIILHQKVTKEEARRQAIEMLAPRSHVKPRTCGGRLSFPAQRRYAPARRHCHGPVLPSQPVDRR